MNLWRSTFFRQPEGNLPPTRSPASELHPHSQISRVASSSSTEFGPRAIGNAASLLNQPRQLRAQGYYSKFQAPSVNRLVLSEIRLREVSRRVKLLRCRFQSWAGELVRFPVYHIPHRHNHLDCCRPQDLELLPRPWARSRSLQLYVSMRMTTSWTGFKKHEGPEPADSSACSQPARCAACKLRTVCRLCRCCRFQEQVPTLRWTAARISTLPSLTANFSLLVVITEPYPHLVVPFSAMPCLFIGPGARRGYA